MGMIAEGEIQTAQGILNASAITVPTGSLINGAYDEVGNFYQMPEHIISDPANLVEETRAFQENTRGESSADDDTDEDESLAKRREEKGKGVLKSGDIVRVKARLSDRGGPDIIITMGKQQNVRILVRRIQEETNVRGQKSRLLCSQDRCPRYELLFLTCSYADMLSSSKQIPGKPKMKIRIAYLGKILKENETLLAQGWREGHVVNALVFGSTNAT